MSPLTGLRMLEFEAIGPGPFASVMLADVGADALLVDRPAGSDLGLGVARPHDVMLRGHRSVVLDLERAEGVAAALAWPTRPTRSSRAFRRAVVRQR